MTTVLLPKSDIEVIPLLSELPQVMAFSTLRGRVEDEDMYSGFNVCHYTGDTQVHIEQSRARLAAALSIAPEQLVIPRQTHSQNVRAVDGYPCMPEDTDALVARADSGVWLCVNTADCLPVVFADVRARVAAVAHAGWKGVAGDIAGRTVDVMKSVGSKVGDIHVAIGPHICGCCYETEAEFARQFDRYAAVTHSSAAQGKAYVDLAACVVRQLLDAGIGEGSISDCGVCTFEHPDRLFSARRHGVASGRILTAIGWQ